MARADPSLNLEPPTTTAESQAHDTAIIARMVGAVRSGVPWHRAILTAISEWRSPDETLPDGRYYQYLTGGEAFDWVLLADRLAEEIADCLPPEQMEALLFHGVLPEELTDDEFRRLIGPEKYRAHLNYIYGIRVEEALYLAVEEEVHKEHRGAIWRSDPRTEESVYQRIYGKHRDELLQMFREETGAPDTGDHASLAQLREFTYWLFKFRLRRGEPARIASDTRKGIAQLSRMELVRRASPLFTTPETNGSFIEVRARLR